MSTEDNKGRELEPRRTYTIVQSDIALFDTAKFEHIQRVATAMASASLLPHHIMMDKDRNLLAPQQIVANCFLIVNRAMAWHMDPIALAQASFVLHGKLGFEGKVIAAAIESAVGSLDYDWKGTPGKDDFKIIVTGKRPSDGKIVSIDGTVGDWKTFEKDNRTVKANWTGLASRNQLAYRGGQEWARLYAPSLLLGVYSVDELTDPRFNGITIDGETEEPPAPTTREPAKRGPGRPKKEPANRMQQAANGSEEKDDDKAAGDAGDAADGEGDGGGSAAGDGSDGAQGEGAAADGDQTDVEVVEEEDPPVPGDKKAAPAKPAERPAQTVEQQEAADDAGAKFLEQLIARVGPDAPLKKDLKERHEALMPITDFPVMKEKWSSMKPFAGVTKAQLVFINELRDWHKNRAQANEVSDEPPAPGDKTKADDAPFDLEKFKAFMEKQLATADSADDVNKFYAEMIAGPLADKLITQAQIDDEIFPIADVALGRFM